MSSGTGKTVCCCSVSKIPRLKFIFLSLVSGIGKDGNSAVLQNFLCNPRCFVSGIHLHELDWSCSSYTFAVLATCSFWNFFLFADAFMWVPSIQRLFCAINDPWELRYLHPPSQYLFENPFSNFPSLAIPLFLYYSRKTLPVARFFDTLQRRRNCAAVNKERAFQRVEQVLKSISIFRKSQ